MDSSAGANVALRDDFSNFKPVAAPRIPLTIAHGETTENHGAGKVTSFSRDGLANKGSVYEAPVDMPILAASNLAQECELGSKIK